MSSFLSDEVLLINIGHGIKSILLKYLDCRAYSTKSHPPNSHLFLPSPNVCLRLLPGQGWSTTPTTCRNLTQYLATITFFTNSQVEGHSSFSQVFPNPHPQIRHTGSHMCLLDVMDGKIFLFSLHVTLHSGFTLVIPECLWHHGGPGGGLFLQSVRSYESPE